MPGPYFFCWLDRLCLLVQSIIKLAHLAQTVKHIFCLCFRVKTAWLWLRGKLIEVLSDQGPAPALSNTELLMMMYPRCRQEAEAAFLLSTCLELVDKVVLAKQKELMVGTIN